MELWLESFIKLIAYAVGTGLFIGILVRALGLMTRDEYEKGQQELKDLINSKVDKK